MSNSLGIESVNPDSLNCVISRRFHGYLFVDSICFSLTEDGGGNWYVGNGMRGKSYSCLSAALDAFLKMLSEYGVKVFGTKRLWALKIARCFRKATHD